MNERLHVGCAVFDGDEGILHAKAVVEDLAERYTIQELSYDPWRARQLALELEQRRIPCVQFPQTMSRMCPASEGLYRAIVEERVIHGNNTVLNAHIAAAVAKTSPRGWQLARAPGGGNVDAAISLAMCVERRASEPKAQPTRFLGWL